jgi:GNAT superfamily N-acetyltransferase
LTLFYTKKNYNQFVITYFTTAMIELKKIDFAATFSVRHPVLRQGKPIESCFFDGDDFLSTVHFGLYYDKKLVGVISVFKNKNSIFSAENQFQIRGMAVREEYQGKKLGKQLLLRGEEYVLSQKSDLIWFNAREIAVPFYQNSGYEIAGNAFEIKEVGTHYIMYKYLQP